MSTNNDEAEGTIANQPKRSKSNNSVYFQSEATSKKKGNQIL
jgi:hypothetical protein